MSILKNPRHESFCQAYIRCGNATKSYESAGYENAGAAQSASKLLRNAKVVARIAELRGQLEIASQRQLQRQFVSRTASIKSNRVVVLDEVVKRILAVVEERAADESLAHIPGGRTGLLVASRKVIGGGKNAQVVEEAVVDAALLKELRETLKQVAIETGQWVEKSMDAKLDLNSLSDEALLELARGTQESSEPSEPTVSR